MINEKGTGKRRKTLLLLMSLALLPVQDVFLQTLSAFPVHITAGPAPWPVKADGRTALAYELHITNFSASPVELLQLDVLGDDSTALLASYRDTALDKRLFFVGGTDSMGMPRTIGGGRNVVIYVDLSLDSHTRCPLVLHHRFRLSIPRKKGGPVINTITGTELEVVKRLVPVLHAPLRGAPWVAFNALFSENHRRVFNPVNGKERIAERFAIDWMCLGPDGRLFHDDAGKNDHFYSYGAEVLAVADARVSMVKDSLPDNQGNNEISGRHTTLDNIAGNYVILDLGNGCFALYGHLKPGSLNVKAGDRVKAGQVLALLGNSGNSDAPHLHFQLMDANSPLGSEGIPCAFETFTQLGVAADPEALDAGKDWHPVQGAQRLVYRRSFPVDNAVVLFP